MAGIAEAPLHITIFVAAAMPGPCVVLTLARTSAAGASAGLRVTGGVMAGAAVVTLVAFAAMLGAISIADAALTLMKWLGVAVLLALAAHTLLGTLRPGAAPLPPGPGRRDGWAGAAVVICSPSVLIFLIAMLPQFLTGGSSDLGPALRAALVFLAGVASAQVAAVALGYCSIRLGMGPRRWADRASGLLLVAFAGMAAFAN